MKVLFLEDDHNRIKKARQGFIGCSLTVVETAQDAIAALESNTFDLASLDHDLGGGYLLASDDNSGYAVAKHLAQMDDPPFVLIHSFNPAGAENMMHCLAGRGGYYRALWDTPDYWLAVRKAKEQVAGRSAA